MQYLLFLNRFDKDKNILEKKLEKLNIKTIAEEDENLLVECESIDELLKLQEISKIVKVFSKWKPLNFKNMKEDSLKAVIDSKCKSYKIQTKFYQKIKISAKSIYKHINPYLKHEGFVVSEDKPEIILFIEFSKANEEIIYRVSYSLSYWYSPVNVSAVNYSRFIVIIENPTLVDEVSDFLRLCWIFKIPLYVLTQNKEFGRLLKKAQETTKGIDYDLMELFVVDKIPCANTIFLGFSKLARENEKELIDFFAKDNNSNKDNNHNKENINKKIALVFGDDKFGMTQDLRDKMDFMFRLTPEVKKPLRASHAVSYVLGIYTALKLH